MVQGAQDSHLLAFRICCGKLAQQESRLPLTFWAPWAKPRKTHKRGENIMQQLNKAYLCEASPEWPYDLWWTPPLPPRPPRTIKTPDSNDNLSFTRKAAARAGTGQKTHHISPFSVICNAHDYRKKGWPVVACRHEKKSVKQLWEKRKLGTYLRVFSGSSNFSISYVQKCIQMSTEYVTAFTARSYTSTIFSGVPRRASWSAYFFQ